MKCTPCRGWGWLGVRVYIIKNAEKPMLHQRSVWGLIWVWGIRNYVSSRGRVFEMKKLSNGRQAGNASRSYETLPDRASVGKRTLNRFLSLGESQP